MDGEVNYGVTSDCLISSKEFKIVNRLTRNTVFNKNQNVIFLADVEKVLESINNELKKLQ